MQIRAAAEVPIVSAILSIPLHLLPMFAAAPSPTPKCIVEDRSSGHMVQYLFGVPSSFIFCIETDDTSSKSTSSGRRLMKPASVQQALTNLHESNSSKTSLSQQQELKLNIPVQLASEYETGMRIF